MILTAKDLTLLVQIELHCTTCIRACAYGAVSCASKDTMWAFTHNWFWEAAVIHGCKMFGSRREKTHYAHFFEGKSIAIPHGTHLTVNCVNRRLRDTVKMTDDEYATYWKSVKKVRDQYFVHNDWTETDRPVLPDLNILKTIALEMRGIIRDVLSQTNCEDPERHTNVREYVNWNSNEKFLRELDSDCIRLKTLMDPEKVEIPEGGV